MAGLITLCSLAIFAALVYAFGAFVSEANRVREIGRDEFGAVGDEDIEKLDVR